MKHHHVYPVQSRLSLSQLWGALHTGHLHLVDLAKQQKQKVLVSIFVNPTQFAPDEDFARYPRSLASDLQLLRDRDVDYVYLPNATDIYPNDFQTYVSNPVNSDILCGAARPHHFRGVLTVVLKFLLNIKPQAMVLGKKDYQQLVLIKKMIQDFCLPVQIIAGETQRAADGLAMSSRNNYLSQEERKRATLLHRALLHAQQAYLDGEQNPDKLTAVATNILAEKLTVEYLEIRKQHDLSPVNNPLTTPAIMLSAVRLGTTRLLDNVEL